MSGERVYRTCATCQGLKPLDAMSRRPENRSGYGWVCLGCLVARTTGTTQPLTFNYFKADQCSD